MKNCLASGVTIGSFLLASSLSASAAGPASSNLPLPTAEQAAWQDDEVSMFFHLDIPVFTDGVNWKSCGHLDPNIFNPAKLDTDQWMEAAKAIGAKHTVFVAKHCSGFIHWQSDAYPYGLKQTTWRDGKGDILRDYMASSEKAGIKPGLYVSWPANGYFGVDRGRVNFGKGGDPDQQAAYVKAYEKLVTEAYGNYGPFCEIWFDGSVPGLEQGGPDVVPLLKKFQAHAVVFQGPTSSIRWIGNENGIAPSDCWATVSKRSDSGGGTPDGTIWMPGECDVPLRGNQWFWRPNAEGAIRSVEDLMHIYYCSVGHNANLILNANIDRDGRVPEADMRRYREFGAEIQRRFGKSIAEDFGKGDAVTLKLGGNVKVDTFVAMEDIRQGERVREFVIEGLSGETWKELFKGQCIGHKRIANFSPVEVSEIRLRVTKSVAPPVFKKFAVFDVADTPAK